MKRRGKGKEEEKEKEREGTIDPAGGWGREERMEGCRYTVSQITASSNGMACVGIPVRIYSVYPFPELKYSLSHSRHQPFFFRILRLAHSTRFRLCKAISLSLSMEQNPIICEFLEDPQIVEGLQILSLKLLKPNRIPVIKLTKL